MCPGSMPVLRAPGFFEERAWTPEPCLFDLSRTGRHHPSYRASCSDTLLPHKTCRSMCYAGWMNRIGHGVGIALNPSAWLRPIGRACGT